MNFEEIEKIIKKIKKYKEKKYLIIIYSDKTNPVLLQKKINYLMKKYELNKKNILFFKDEENEIPLFLISEYDEILIPKKIYKGYNFQ